MAGNKNQTVQTVVQPEAPNTAVPKANFEAMLQSMTKVITGVRSKALLGYIELGNNVRHLMDDKKYGDHSLEEMADYLNISTTTLYDYKNCAMTFSTEDIKIFCEKAVPFRVLNYLRRVKNEDKKEELKTKLIEGEVEPQEVEALVKQYNADQTDLDKYKKIEQSAEEKKLEKISPPDSPEKTEAITKAQGIKAKCFRVMSNARKTKDSLDTVITKLQDLDYVANEDLLYSTVQLCMAEEALELKSLLASCNTHVKKLAACITDEEAIKLLKDAGLYVEAKSTK